MFQHVIFNERLQSDLETNPRILIRIIEYQDFIKPRDQIGYFSDDYIYKKILFSHYLDDN